MIKVEACLWCGSKSLTKIAVRKDSVPILKCENCRLVMNGLLPESSEDSYDESYFNAVESNIEKGIETGYASTHYLISPAFLLWQSSLIEELNESHKRLNFLEIGAATGNLLDILKETQANLNLKGIDISEYAVNVARSKGYDVKRAVIEKYKSPDKLDIIFSSETMEHLENLKTFLLGVKKNLNRDGTFLFYVPSISEEDAIKEGDKYLRFNVNLEHLLHFSPEFFKTELPKFFNADVVVKEFKSSYGPSVVGAVSNGTQNLSKLESLFNSLDKETIPTGASARLLRNLDIIALKFGKFEYADKISDKLRKAKEPIELIDGLKSYHLGHLEKADEYFQLYLKNNPASSVAKQLLLVNERELKNIYREKMYEYSEQLSKIDSQNLKKSGLIKRLKDKAR